MRAVRARHDAIVLDIAENVDPINELDPTEKTEAQIQLEQASLKLTDAAKNDYQQTVETND